MKNKRVIFLIIFIVAILATFLYSILLSKINIKETKSIIAAELYRLDFSETLTINDLEIIGPISRYYAEDVDCYGNFWIANAGEITEYCCMRKNTIIHYALYRNHEYLATVQLSDKKDFIRFYHDPYIEELEKFSSNTSTPLHQLAVWERNSKETYIFTEKSFGNVITRVSNTEQPVYQTRDIMQSYYRKIKPLLRAADGSFIKAKYSVAVPNGIHFEFYPQDGAAITDAYPVNPLWIVFLSILSFISSLAIIIRIYQKIRLRD